MVISGYFRSLLLTFAGKKEERRGLLLSVSYDSSIRTVSELSDCTMVKPHDPASLLAEYEKIVADNDQVPSEEKNNYQS